MGIVLIEESSHTHNKNSSISVDCSSSPGTLKKSKIDGSI